MKKLLLLFLLCTAISFLCTACAHTQKVIKKNCQLLQGTDNEWACDNSP